MPWLAWLGTRLAHWLVYMILTAIVLWSAYVTIIKPHTKPTPTTEQRADTINNYNVKPTFGCMRFEVMKQGSLSNITNDTK